MNRALGIALPFLLAVASACTNSHTYATNAGTADSEGEMNMPSVDGGPSDDTPTDSPPTDNPMVPTDPPSPCGDIKAVPGRVQATLSSYDLGDVPLDLSVECGPNGKAFMVHAEDGLSTFSLALPLEGHIGEGIPGSAVLDFESLAKFQGECGVCTDETGTSGTLTCTTLVWNVGHEPVKAAFAGSFRCPE